MNSFCKTCTGNNNEEIVKCDDRNCPFHKYRKGNLNYQDDSKQVELAIPFDGNIGSTGTVTKR
jgi:hypothetical protein